MKDHRSSLSAVIATFVIAIAVTPVVAQALRSELSIEAGAADAGTTAKVSIRSKSPVAMGALQFDLVYDPAMVRFKGIENGPLLTAALVEANVVEPGRARVALVSNEEVKGDGVLLIAELDILEGPSGTTSIGLEAVRGWDQANNLPVNIAAQGGELTRTVAQKAEPVPQKPADGSMTWIYVATAVVTFGAMILLLRRKNSTK